MSASSFLPEQTTSDVASITFEVMVAEEGAPMPEPEPEPRRSLSRNLSRNRNLSRCQRCR